MKPKEREQLLQALRSRFEKHMYRHKGVTWADVQARLEARPDALRSLAGMEASGGEPDVVGTRAAAGGYTFVDCAAESGGNCELSKPGETTSPSPA